MKPFAFLALLILLLGSCETPSSSVSAPTLVSFEFPESLNSVLSGSGDVTGSVDASARTVTVTMPHGITDWSALTPRITLSSGASVSPVVTARDFSASPTLYTVTVPGAGSVVYSVIVQESPALAAASAVILSEYYAGTEYAVSGTLNQYLEVTNRSSAAVDLSQYSLRHNVWEGATRRADKDVEVPLTGTLAAGASFVLYSSRLKTSTFTTITGLTGLKAADTTFNTIIGFTGTDGYQLVRSGTVLDAIGPAGGVGTGQSWGKLKRMLRKATAVPSATWDEKEWITYAVAGTNDDAVNAGAATPVVSTTDTSLTFCTIEGLDSEVYSTIDSTAKTVTISVLEGTSMTLPISISTPGLGVTYNGATVESGVTLVDFSEPRTFRVWARNGVTYKDYVVTLGTYHPLGFTTTNYDFTGGIAAAVTAIRADGTWAGGTLEGILTAKDLYMSGTYKYSFTIQDGAAGVLVLSSASITPSVGQRVRVTATAGSLYYDLPEITEFSAVTAVSATIHDLYYQTGDYNNAGAVGEVFRWTGTIEAGTNSYLVGTFTGDLYFHAASGYTSSLAADKSGTFTGPVTYSYSQYRMELNSDVQIQM